MNQQIMLLLLPLMTSILLKGSQKKLDVKNAIQYSNEKCLISVTMRSLAELANVTIDSDSATRKGGRALCAGNAVALLVFGPVMP